MRAKKPKSSKKRKALRLRRSSRANQRNVVNTSANIGNGTPGAITGDGAFQEGVTLSAPAVTRDPDGMPTNPNYTYQWFRNNIAITGATAKTYTVPSNGAGTYRTSIAYTDAKGFRTSLSSANQEVSQQVYPSIGAGERLQGRISARGEKDLFSIDVNPGHRITIRVSPTSAPYPIVNIVDKNGNVLVAGTYGESTTHILTNGPAYAEVYGYGGNTGDYTISLESDPYLTDAQMRGRALELIGSSSVDDRLKAGDYRYYKISVPPGSIIKASVKADSDMFPLIEITNQSGDVLQTSASYGSRSAATGMFPVGGGTYFLKVRTQSGSAGTFTASLLAQDSEEAMLNEVLRLTNLERSSRGISPLSRNRMLDIAADMHSENMGIHDIYGHTGHDGSSPGDRISGAGYNWTTYGENIYKSPFTAVEAVTGWMNSPGHRANILNPNFNEIGLGYSYDAASATTYWTQKFASAI